MSNDKAHHRNTGADPFKMACDRLHIPIINYFISMNLDKPCIAAGLNEFTAITIPVSGLPIDILRQSVSRGLIDSLINAAEDFGILNEPMAYNFDGLLSIISLIFTMNCPESFELIFRTCFPFWRSLPPRRKQEILMPLPFGLSSYEGDLFWTADAFRLLFCPDGPVRKIDVQAWNDGGASLLHQVFSCYLSSSRRRDRGWKRLLEEVIEATDDMHYKLELPYAHVDFRALTCSAVYVGARSALEWTLVAVLNGLLMDAEAPQAPVRRVLKKLMWKLQAIMSVLDSCGYDLLEFGRQEAAVWVSEDNTDRTVDDTLCLGIGDQHDGLPYVRALHYGSVPDEWYFELDFHYEDYAGDFWNLLENPHLLMPGAWIEAE